MSNLELTRAERLDQYVARELPTISRAHAAKLVETGKVEINGAANTKPGYKIRATDDVVIHFDPAELADIPKIDLEVVYEDPDCVVIIKPEGILSHSKGAYNPEGTVASWLADKVISLTGERAGVVHRLDRATSGVMICAKSPSAITWLQKQFAARKVQKTYYAVIQGTLDPARAVIDMPIERNPRTPQTFRVGSNGKPATTEYEVIESVEKYSLVKLKPTTGRTHQLRVHLAHLGHPIVGDPLYGGEPADRLYLHAESLELTIPNREHKTFSAPLPNSFRALVRG